MVRIGHRSYLIFILIVSLLAAFSSVFLMTLEYDEAWILTSTQQMINPDVASSVRPVFTTGGIYAIVVRSLVEIGVPVWYAGRLFSFVSLIFLLLFTGFVLKSRKKAVSIEIYIVLVMMVAAPGTILLGSMAYGVVSATLLFFVSIYYWLKASNTSFLQWFIPGVGIGLAIATRATFLPLLPVLLLWSLTGTEKRKKYFISAVFATTVALATFAFIISIHIYLHGNHLATPLDALKTYFGSSGADKGFTTAARLISFFVKGSLFVPIFIILIVSYLSWKHPKPFDNNYQDHYLLQILTLAGLFLGIFWIFKSPFQHIRYIWPAVLFFYIAAGIYLGYLYRWLVNNPLTEKWSFLCVLFSVGLAIGTIASAVRLIAMGAAMQVNYAGLENLDNHFKAFYLIQEQASMVKYLDTHTDNKDIIVDFAIPGEWSGMKLSLLSYRKIYSIDDWKSYDIQPSVVLTHKFSPLNLNAEEWLEKNFVLVKSLSGYKVYQPKEKNVPFPDGKVLIELQKTRFGLQRALSLSGS